MPVDGTTNLRARAAAPTRSQRCAANPITPSRVYWRAIPDKTTSHTRTAPTKPCARRRAAPNRRRPNRRRRRGETWPRCDDEAETQQSRACCSRAARARTCRPKAAFGPESSRALRSRGRRGASVGFGRSRISAVITSKDVRGPRTSAPRPSLRLAQTCRVNPQKTHETPNAE